MGRYVPAGRSLLLPLILVVVGVGQAAHAPWNALGAVVVAAELVLTAGLGLVRGSAIRLTLREGYLYQRGGWLSVGLWLLTIGVRLAVELPFLHTSAAPAVQATLVLSFGVSLTVQFLVFNARIARDPRPIRPAGDRRAARGRSTLAR